MSIFADSAANAHLTISAPAAGGVGNGAYTVGILYKTVLFVSSAMIWRAYQANNFSHRGLYADGDMWIINQQADTDIPSFGNPVQWYWLVASKGSADEAPRAHWAVYDSSGVMTWTHQDALSSQSNQSAIDRFCLGDEFGDSFKGHAACLTAFTSELSDFEVELYFGTDSAGIMSASPQFFVHWPEAVGVGSPFSDIAGGGSEIIRTGTWTATADPPGYDFDLVQPRTGQPKVWNGSSWVSKPAKIYDGAGWPPHPINGYDGSQWTTSK